MSLGRETSWFPYLHLRLTTNKDITQSSLFYQLSDSENVELSVFQLLFATVFLEISIYEALVISCVS